MNRRLHYLISLAPLFLVLSSICLADWAYAHFGCTANGKEFLRCDAFGFNISAFLSLGKFYGPLLLPAAWFVSVPWFIVVLCMHIEHWRKQNRTP